jgi:predicted small secreted protein
MKMISVQKLLALFLLGGFLTVSLGCETIKGVGRDITNLGEAIDDATR